MKSYNEAMYWMTDDEWYTVNYEENRFELTQKATPRVVESFRMWLRQNNLPDDPLPIHYGMDVYIS